MTTVVDFAKRRARKHPPVVDTRPADFRLEGWVEDGKVTWVWLEGNAFFPVEEEQSKRMALLIEALWVVSDDDQVPWEKKFAAMVFVDNECRQWARYNTAIATDTTWRHGWWLLRRWVHFSRWWLALAWRAARGKG